eukprot:9496635-Pyramimonas_sp.AAC.1
MFRCLGACWGAPDFRGWMRLGILAPTRTRIRPRSTRPPASLQPAGGSHPPHLALLLHIPPPPVHAPPVAHF